MFVTQSWMQPLEPVHGVKVTHRIHVKVWHIATDVGVLTVELNWQTGDMVARLRQDGEK